MYKYNYSINIRQMREDFKTETEPNETPMRKPYNMRERKIKEAAYRDMIRAELADELYDKILNILVMQKNIRMRIILQRSWQRN